MCDRLFHHPGLGCVLSSIPSRSAFNRIERRMVKFSQELSGIVLPHDKFGSHLNSKGETIDSELEKKIFMHLQVDLS